MQAHCVALSQRWCMLDAHPHVAHLRWCARASRGCLLSRPAACTRLALALRGLSQACLPLSGPACASSSQAAETWSGTALGCTLLQDRGSSSQQRFILHAVQALQAH
jgi:hypothetical protein